MRIRFWELDIGHWTFPALLAAWGGFLLSWQTVWILRPGMLGGVPWPLATIGVYTGDVVLFVAAVGGAVRMARMRSRGVGPVLYKTAVLYNTRRFWVAGVLLLSVAAVNTWVSADPALSASGWVRITLFLLALVGIPVWSTAARRAFAYGFLLAMLGHAAFAIGQFIAQSVPASTLLGTAFHAPWIRGTAVVETVTGRWLRPYGGFPHPNVLGMGMLVGMMVLATVPIRSFIIHHSSFLICTFALLLSFSRSALLGLCILLAVLVVRRSTRTLAFVGAGMAIAMLAITWSLWLPRVTVSGATETRSFTERRSAITTAFAFSAIPPFLGVGLHAMPQAITAFDAHRDPYTAQPAHNVPLLAAAEIGWIGIALLLLAAIHLFPNWSLVIARPAKPWRSGGHWSFVLPLLPPLMFDHALWSLPVGVALVFVFTMSTYRVREAQIGPTP